MILFTLHEPVGIFHGVGETYARQLILGWFLFFEPHFARLQESILYATPSITDVVPCEHALFHKQQDVLAPAPYLFLGIPLQFSENLLQCLGLFHLVDGGFALMLLLVSILIDVVSQGLHPIADVPSFALFYLFPDVVQYPLLHLLSFAQMFHDTLHSAVYHLLAVQFYAHARGKSQFSGERMEDALEERVDGLHPESIVVVQDATQCCLGPLAKDGLLGY